jgi:hypothetical protein
VLSAAAVFAIVILPQLFFTKSGRAQVAQLRNVLMQLRAAQTTQ